MKKILLSLTIMLSGCTAIDAYLMAKYDTNEYALVNDIRAKSFVSVSDCKQYDVTVNNLKQIYLDSNRFLGFTQNIPRNEEATRMAEKLFTLTKGAKEYYETHDKVSEIFCKSKLQQINKSAEEIQAVLARKPR